ncbi:MFS transporter [Nocardioides sp. GCM10027113]|uniref:MFS transporter n=1 Tax=unclassified Nocardioides TaxID=2615069 RepID=UPI0036175EEA
MLSRLGFPSLGHHRRFVTAIAVDAVGSGVFMPVTMLYFLAVTPLTLVEVGAAVSIASLVALPAGPLLGALVDRVSAKRVLLTGNALQGLGFAAYLVSESFGAVLLWTIVVTVGRTAFWGSYGNIVTVISLPGERERWFGFLGALRNVGFAVGGLAAGVAVSVGTDLAFHTVVALNAASYAVAWWLLLAVPDPRPAATHEALPGTWLDVLADRPYRLLVVAQVGYSLPMMILNFALPVYAVTVLGLPGWITGVVFTVNCLMVGVGQGLVVNAMTGRVRFRILLLTQAFFAASYVVWLGASVVPVAAAVVVMVLGGMVYTMAELMGGPVLAALGAEAAADHLRGRYLSLLQVAWNLSSTVAPVTFAWLLDRGPSPLWLVMLGFSAVSALVVHRLGRVLPHAGERVTNRVAEPSEALA